MITTTLNRIRAHGPCKGGWTKLLAGLNKAQPDDEPLPYAEIVAICGLDDALWCTRAEPQHAATWRLYAVWCARQVAHLMTDPRSLAVLDMAERYAHGEATDEELTAAWDAADAAWYAAWDAACVASAAWDAADTACAASAPACVALAAREADSAARNAAREAASAAAQDAQTAEFLRIVNA